MKCWIDHCQNKLEFACPCKNPPIYSCDSHIISHLKTKSASGHHPEPLTFSPNPNTKRALIDYLHQSLLDLYDCRRIAVNDFSKKLQQINEQLKNTLKSFDQAIKDQRKIISQISLVETIPNANKTKLDKILNLEPEKSVERLKNCFDIFDKSNYLINDEGKLMKTSSSLNESNRFVVFRFNSTKIVQTDLNSFSSTEFNLSLDSPKNHYITMCLIPENSIFCYGNYPTSSNAAFIIEPNNSVKSVINAPISLGLSGSIYYKSIVYIFGGYTGSTYATNAFKYHLLENKWENLNSMPVASSFVSCVAKNSKILLSGRQHSKIYCYNIIQNSYIELHNIQSGMRRKIVCENDRNAYVIEAGGNIYESNHEWKVWSTIGSSGTENTDLIGCKVLWQNKFYFVFWTYNLYEFDLKEKKCRKVKTIQ